MELYSDEELGLIEGLVIPYLSWKSSSPSLREAYRRVHSHILERALDREDLRYIRMGLK